MSNSLLKKITLASFLILLLFGPQLLRAETYNFAGDSGLNSTAGKSGFDQSKKSPEAVVQPIITAILSLIGVLFLGLAIFGGVKWMTARGNEQQLEAAKQILTNAIVGLIVIAAAYAITYFILKNIASSSFKGI